MTDATPPAPRERTETEWRAEQTDAGIEHGWCVVEFSGPHEELIAEELTEQQARLIAAAPAKERLCEELANVLEGWSMFAESLTADVPSVAKNPKWQKILQITDAALKAAGRAPG